MADVTPILQPDPEQMRRHLAHLFDGWLDGLHDGLVELAWTDSRDGRLRHAQLYGTDRLDELVERAVQVNIVPRQNVYVGQALRRPGTAPFGRASDADVLALTALYVDLDDDVLETAKERYRTGKCPPTAVVVTGRQPHVRSQLLWRLESPEQDLDLCRRQNAALARALGGDPSVVNPSRVLRMAGSVAWPMKPGRVIERTELHEFSDGRAKVYLFGQIARAFPAVNDDAPHQAQATSSTPGGLNIGTPDSVSVDGCLAAIRAGQHWHNNMVRLVGHWILRGWSDAEIQAAAEGLTLPGYTADQTRTDVASMIAGGRRKWNIASPQRTIDEAEYLGTPLQSLAPAFIDSLPVTMLPRRPWVLGRSLIRGHVTVEVAPPGVGKSTLSIEQAVAIVTGEAITGQEVHETGKVWVCNIADDAVELKRRLAAVLQHWNIPFAAVRGQLALNSGADRPLMVARADRDGNVIRLPDVDACIEQIRAQGIRVLIVDPFVETHAVEENANEQIKAVAALFREIARKGDCAVLLVHHTAKPPQGSSDGHAGNMNTARGASALVGVARVVQTLFAMSARDAGAEGENDGFEQRQTRTRGLREHRMSGGSGDCSLQ